jgi:hypothetical protein
MIYYISEYLGLIIDQHVQFQFLISWFDQRPTFPIPFVNILVYSLLLSLSLLSNCGYTNFLDLIEVSLALVAESSFVPFILVCHTMSSNTTRCWCSFDKDVSRMKLYYHRVLDLVQQKQFTTVK